MKYEEKHRSYDEEPESMRNSEPEAADKGLLSQRLRGINSYNLAPIKAGNIANHMPENHIPGNTLKTVWALYLFDPAHPIHSAAPGSPE